MTWALSYLYIQLVLHARGSAELAGITLGTLLTVLVTCIVLCFISVVLLPLIVRYTATSFSTK